MAKSYVKKTPAEKHQQIVEITEKLDKELHNFMDSEKFKTFLKTMSKFHNYSFANTMLIAMQKPDSTLVAGFRAWETNFNRHVKKGEKGIKILAPSPIKRYMEQEVLDPKTNKPVLDADGNVLKEQVQVTIPNFHVVTVFDVSSTEGEPLPQLGVNELTGKVDGYKNIIKAVESISPVPISYEQIDSGAKGYFSPAEQRIVIQKDMSELQTLKTFLHEIAHSLLHDKDGARIEEIEDAQKKSRNTKEIEAESIACVVAEYFGLDTSDYSFGYIAGWASSLELKELKESMETIRKTASHMITGIEDKLRDIVKDKERSPKTIKEKIAEGELKKASQVLKQVNTERSKEQVIA